MTGNQGEVEVTIYRGRFLWGWTALLADRNRYVLKYNALPRLTREGARKAADRAATKILVGDRGRKETWYRTTGGMHQ